MVLYRDHMYVMYLEIIKLSSLSLSSNYPSIIQLSSNIWDIQSEKRLAADALWRTPKNPQNPRRGFIMKGGVVPELPSDSVKNRCWSEVPFVRGSCPEGLMNSQWLSAGNQT